MRVYFFISVHKRIQYFVCLINIWYSDWPCREPMPLLIISGIGVTFSSSFGASDLYASVIQPSLVQTMACRLVGHYLNQWWNIVNWINFFSKFSHSYSICLQMSSAKWWSFCLGLYVLNSVYHEDYPYVEWTRIIVSSPIRFICKSMWK